MFLLTHIGKFDVDERGGRYIKLIRLILVMHFVIVPACGPMREVPGLGVLRGMCDIR